MACIQNNNQAIHGKYGFSENVKVWNVPNGKYTKVILIHRHWLRRELFAFESFLFNQSILSGDCKKYNISRVLAQTQTQPFRHDFVSTKWLSWRGSVPEESESTKVISEKLTEYSATIFIQSLFVLMLFEFRVF